MDGYAPPQAPIFGERPTLSSWAGGSRPGADAGNVLPPKDSIRFSPSGKETIFASTRAESTPSMEYSFPYHQRKTSHNTTMTEPVTTVLLDAKIETVEAKMDGRLARIEDKFSAIDRQFGEVRSMISEQKTTAWKAAGAIIGAMGVMFGIYVAAFDSGRDTAKLAAEAQLVAAQSQRDVAKVLEDVRTTATNASAETAAALSEIRQIVGELKASPPPATVKP